jgi:hypothetical protein
MTSPIAGTLSIASLLGMGLAILGCGGTAARNDGIPLERYGEEWKKAVCDWAVTCGLIADRAACVIERAVHRLRMRITLHMQHDPR